MTLSVKSKLAFPIAVHDVSNLDAFLPSRRVRQDGETAGMQSTKQYPFCFKTQGSYFHQTF